MDEVGIICLAAFILGPYLAFRMEKWGTLTGVLVVWLVPAAVRHVWFFAGDSSQAGFGLGVHVIFGWALGLMLCVPAKLLGRFVRKRSGGSEERPDPN